MADNKKISRRELFTFWRKPAPSAKPVAPPVPAGPDPLEVAWGRPWPRDRIPGPSLGRALPLRPPGTMHEYILRDACTRCGNCVEACPADAIYALDASWGTGQGTPAIDPRKSPCVVCNGYQCTRVCPSGAIQAVFNTDQIIDGHRGRRRAALRHLRRPGVQGLRRGLPGRGRHRRRRRWPPEDRSAQAASAAACACGPAPPNPTSIEVVPRD